MFKQQVETHVIKKKESITTVLEDLKRRQREEIKAAMKIFNYFDTWSEEIVEECSHRSAIKTCSPKDVLKAKDEAHVELAYFLLKGSCVAVRKMVVVKGYDKMGKLSHYKLHKDQTMQVPTSDEVEIIIMQTTRLYPGACFGLGEKSIVAKTDGGKVRGWMAKRKVKIQLGRAYSGWGSEKLGEKCVVTAETEVTYLMIPRLILLQNSPPNSIFVRIVHYMDMEFPTLKRLLKEFQEKRMWKLHSKRYLKEDKMKRSRGSIHDVPITSRMDQLFPPKVFSLASKKEIEFIRGYRPSPKTEKNKWDRLKARMNQIEAAVEEEMRRKEELAEQEERDRVAREEKAKEEEEARAREEEEAKAKAKEEAESKAKAKELAAKEGDEQEAAGEGGEEEVLGEGGKQDDGEEEGEPAEIEEEPETETETESEEGDTADMEGAIRRPRRKEEEASDLEECEVEDSSDSCEGIERPEMKPEDFEVAPQKETGDFGFVIEEQTMKSKTNIYSDETDSESEKYELVPPEIRSEETSEAEITEYDIQPYRFISRRRAPRQESTDSDN